MADGESLRLKCRRIFIHFLVITVHLVSKVLVEGRRIGLLKPLLLLVEQSSDRPNLHRLKSLQVPLESIELAFLKASYCMSGDFFVVNVGVISAVALVLVRFYPSLGMTLDFAPLVARVVIVVIIALTPTFG